MALGRRRSSRDETYVSTIVKYVMFFLNFLFWLFGGTVIGVGAWAYIDKYGITGHDVRNVFDVILDLSIIFMVVGFVVFSISFAGCLGALRENTCLLKFFSVFMVLIFLAEAVVAIFGFVFPDKVLSMIKQEFSKELIQKYRSRENDDLQNVIDYLQQKFQCCGISDDGFRDWSFNIYYNCTPTNLSVERCGVPFSCCRNPRHLNTGLINTMCGFEVQNKEFNVVTEQIYTEGCIQAMYLSMKENLTIIAGVAVGVACMQLFAIYLARTLIEQIHDQRARWQWQ